ncbi:MAG TPA: shikimate dehydrogenase [Solirubrobacteraceae bacterium]|jgi:shikimate dehydrogenase|nr:shikimate dehydrogenase [Solirubrobacteraceae bacterium]
MADAGRSWLHGEHRDRSKIGRRMTPRRLGVLGWPVAHSRSPAMHNAALAALGMVDWRYQLLPVPPERFIETVRALTGAGFVGANVTIPHKHAALALADTAGEAARAIGAANTLTFSSDGAIAAENTDAPGFIAALGVPPRGMSALVLGAGGSARAVVWALREAGAREVSVWNRTPERAAALARDLGARFVTAAQPADLLVNCTSVGLETAPAGLQQSATEAQGLNLLAVTLDQVGSYPHVVDLVYRSSPTPLLAAARSHGARTVDGLEILLAQGALSFELWTGVRPSLEVMRRALD